MQWRLSNASSCFKLLHDCAGWGPACLSGCSWAIGQHEHQRARAPAGGQAPMRGEEARGTLPPSWSRTAQKAAEPARERRHRGETQPGARVRGGRCPAPPEEGQSAPLRLNGSSFAGPAGGAAVEPHSGRSGREEGAGGHPTSPIERDPAAAEPPRASRWGERGAAQGTLDAGQRGVAGAGATSEPSQPKTVVLEPTECALSQVR